MKWFRVSIVLLALSIAFGVNASTQLTVYNDDLAFVKTDVVFQLEKGLNSIQLGNLPSRLIPTSVHLDTKHDHVTVFEQNYEYDLLNVEAILQKYIGHEVTVQLIGEDNELHTGFLQTTMGEYLVLTDSNEGGRTRLLKKDQIEQIELDNLPDGFFLEPTLVWKIRSSKKIDSNMQLAYLTRGMQWHVEYVGVLDEDQQTMNLQAWVDLNNRCGASFENVDLRLIAGEVSQQKSNEGRFVPYYTDGIPISDPVFQEESFFEYHAYTLDQQVDIRQNQEKQLSMFEKESVVYRKEYEYVINSRRQKEPNKNSAVRTFITFENTKKNQLGIPLPKGLLRCFAKHNDEEQFVGEDHVQHTPKDESVRFLLGKAFDLTAETILEKEERNGNKLFYKTVLRNHKDESVNIKVIFNYPYRDGYHRMQLAWASEEAVHTDASSFYFMINVAADGEKEISFTLH